ncbi:hypothetical protein Bca4012_010463 [Brassica carinata]
MNFRTATSKRMAQREEHAHSLKNEDKWVQEDQLALEIIHIKKIINNLSQEEVEFNQYVGKFKSLWAELDTLRPFSIDSDVIRERCEQDKVFSLLLNLSLDYNQLINHILRQEHLPDLDGVCALVQREQISHTLFTSERKSALKEMHSKNGRMVVLPRQKKAKKRHVRI